jgi:hypothetical protein
MDEIENILNRFSSIFHEKRMNSGDRVAQAQFLSSTNSAAAAIAAATSASKNSGQHTGIDAQIILDATVWQYALVKWQAEFSGLEEERVQLAAQSNRKDLAIEAVNLIENPYIMDMYLKGKSRKLTVAQSALTIILPL